MESRAFWSHVCCCLSVWATIESTPWCIRKSGLLRDNTHQSIIKQTGFLQTFPSFRIFPHDSRARVQFPRLYLTQADAVDALFNPPAHHLGSDARKLHQTLQGVPKATKVDRWFLILFGFILKMIDGDLIIWHSTIQPSDMVILWDSTDSTNKHVG